MATPVIMPKQGQSVESCIIVGWKKQVGDMVKAGDILCEVETDKATFEVESPAAGTLLAIFHEQGADVPVLMPIAAIGSPGENVDAMKGGAASVPSAAAPAAAAAAPAAPAAAIASAVPQTSSGKIKASPRAKAAAAARGVDLAGLRGTGPGGRIIERDVLAAGPASAAGPVSAARPAVGFSPSMAQPTSPSMARAAVIAPAPIEPAPGQVKEVKVTGIRKLISERMLASIQTTAQLTMHTAADARALQSLRKKFKGSLESMGLREVTINDMVMFAVSRVLTQYPDVNALLAGDTLHQHSDVHLGFAVDTPRGLMVPVIRNAHALSLRDMAREAARLVTGCREGGITPAEMAGGTFTVTNLGPFGVHGFTPVLNVPQVGILGVGAIVPGPVQDADGVVSFVPQIALSLTINHQVVDGAPGARFLQALAADVAQFDLLLAR